MDKETKKKDWFKTLNRELLRQVFLYGLIGGVSAGLDTLGYFCLTRYVVGNEFAANFISINIGILTSFILNSRFNFRKTDKIAKRIASFYTIGYLGLLLSMGILWLGVKVLGINDLLVKVVSVFFIAAVQFCLNKILTFGRIK